MCGFTSWPLCLSVESNPLHSLGSELGSGGCVCNIYHGTLDVGVWEASLSQYRLCVPNLNGSGSSFVRWGLRRRDGGHQILDSGFST